MRGKLWFLGGAAIGYVLGTRAGREKYEQIAQTAKKVWEHPTTQETAGMVQDQANRLYHKGRETVGGRMGQAGEAKSGAKGGARRAGVPERPTEQMGKAGVETLADERRPQPGSF